MVFWLQITVFLKKGLSCCVKYKVFPGSRNLAPDSCVAITTQESEARLREPGKTLSVGGSQPIDSKKFATSRCPFQTA